MRIQRIILKGKRNMEDMTEREAEVLAMLIDTDGSICVTGWRPRAAVGMSKGYRIPIENAVLWGGRLYKTYNPRTKNYRYAWRVYKTEPLRSFLMKIKPYLKQKQKQAELALEMLDILDEKPDGYKKRLEELKMEISRLNHARAPDIDISKLKD